MNTKTLFILLSLGFLCFATTTQTNNVSTDNQLQLQLISHRGSSRALLAAKTQPWQEFMRGAAGCIRVVRDAVLCGWRWIKAGLKCIVSLVKCIIPKCSKCCKKFIIKWCVPCKCKWNCSIRKCKQAFKKAANSCKITADSCVRAFNALGRATRDLFKNFGKKLKWIADKIRKAVKWIAEKAWGVIKWIYDQIKKLVNLVKLFEVAKSIGRAFKCFSKLKNIKKVAKEAGKIVTVAIKEGKAGVIKKIESVIAGFKQMICCLQKTAIGRVLNKWGKSLKNFHKRWKGLKVGNFLDDPAIMVSIASSASTGILVKGKSLDFAFSTAFNVGVYTSSCNGIATDVGLTTSVIVNLWRKFSMIPGKHLGINFSVGIPGTPIGVGAGVVLPVGSGGINFGAVNVEVGASNGVSPISIGGHMCSVSKLVEFNLLELIGDILTGGKECPANIPSGSHQVWPTNSPTRRAPVPRPTTLQPVRYGVNWGTYIKANWWRSLDRKGWSNCPTGYALVGLYRNTCHQLHCIEEAACRRSNRGAFTSCRSHNVYSAFDRKGLTSCPRNYYIAGFYRGNCDWIYCIEYFRCCTIPRSYYGRNPRKANWWRSFDRKGWSMVPAHNWITGLWRNSCKQIYCIEEAYYTQPALRPVAPRTVTWGAAKSANWWRSFDRRGWSKCPHGYALTGLYRNSCHELYCLEAALCRRPNYSRPFTYCRAHNVWHAFDRKGLTSCPRNYFLAGFWRNTCNHIYCIEYFWCCHAPGTRYEFNPRKQNWWHSFDRKGWSSVPRNTWITGLWRNSCSKLYCIEEAYYSRPRTVRRRRMVSDNMQNDDLISEDFMKEHQRIAAENYEKDLREIEKQRRLEELEEYETEALAIEDANKYRPTLKKAIRVDRDMCGKHNLEAEMVFMKKFGWDKKTKKEIVTLLCSNFCQKDQSNANECQDARTAVCFHKWLGKSLDTVKECCTTIKNDPGKLVFAIRRWCAREGGVDKPTRDDFCKCSKLNAAGFITDYDCVNIVIDGCEAGMGNSQICERMKHVPTVQDFAKLANQLCKTSLFNEVNGATLFVGAGFIFMAVGIGLRKWSSNKTPDFSYESILDEEDM